MTFEDKEVTFQELEMTFYYEACALARKAMTEAIESLDKKLCTERDKRKYRRKGKRPSTIKTLMGEVTYSRELYLIEDGDSVRTEYLLDTYLKIDENYSSNISLILAEFIENLSRFFSLRKTADIVGTMTQSKISQTTISNIKKASEENKPETQ